MPTWNNTTLGAMDSAACLLSPATMAIPLAHPATGSVSLPVADLDSTSAAGPGSDQHLALASLACTSTARPSDFQASLAAIESTLNLILSASSTTHTPATAVHLIPNNDPDNDTSPTALSNRSAQAQATHVVLADCYTRRIPRLRALVWDWLLCLVRRATNHLMHLADDGSMDDEDPRWIAWDDLSSRASTVMSMLSGPATAGDRTRMFVFDSMTIKVNEASLQAADLGGTTWGAGVVLASLIDQRLVQFPAGASILELGSGTGLGGIAAQLAHPAALVTMTDYHLGVLDTLTANIGLNLPATHSAHNIKVQQLDWRWYLPSTLSALAPPALPHFDAIMAADIVYEHKAVDAIHAVLSALVAHESTLVLIVLPMRPRYHEDVIEFERVVASEFCNRQAVVEYRGGWYKVYGNERARTEMRGLFH